MRIEIVADGIRSRAISTTVSALLGSGALSDSEIRFLYPKSPTWSPHTSIFIVDESRMSSITPESMEAATRSGQKILLHVHGILLNVIDDLDKVAEIEKSLLERHAYSLLKELNGSMIGLSYALREKRPAIYPRYLQVETTSWCNAGCIMCSHVYHGNLNAKHLSTEVLSSLEDVLPYAERVALHGNGEPFLNPSLLDYLEKYSEFGAEICTSTNLSVLDERTLRCISKHLSYLVVSCDGCTEKVYQGIRRGLSFSKFCDNLTTLNQKCPTLPKSMNMVLMAQNIHQLPEMVNFAANYGFQELSINNMTPSVAIGNQADSPLLYKDQVIQQLEKAKAIADRRNIVLRYPLIYDAPAKCDEPEPAPTRFPSDKDIDLRIAYLESTYHMLEPPVESVLQGCWRSGEIGCDGVCEWLIENSYVDVDGNVAVCCVNSKKSLGNLEKASFKSIWNGPAASEIRLSFLEGRLPDFCRACHFLLNSTLLHLKVDDEAGVTEHVNTSKLYSLFCANENHPGAIH